MSETVAPSRKPRADGERTRAAILDAATRLATLEGLEGLSIARLAAHLGMSKSGVFAHFGSKEELQLAAVDRAAEIFRAEIVEPARAAAPEAGLRRLEALGDAFISYIDREVFPGGCFFSAVGAEFDTQPGPVNDLILEYQRTWFGALERVVRKAQEAGEISADEDPEQLAFELHGLLEMGGKSIPIFGKRTALERGRAAFRRRLEVARA